MLRKWCKLIFIENKNRLPMVSQNPVLSPQPQERMTEGIEKRFGRTRLASPVSHLKAFSPQKYYGKF